MSDPNERRIQLSLRRSDSELFEPMYDDDRSPPPKPFIFIDFGPYIKAGGEVSPFVWQPELQEKGDAEFSAREQEARVIATFVHNHLRQNGWTPRYLERCPPDEIEQKFEGVFEDAFLYTTRDGCVSQPEIYCPPSDPFIVENHVALERLWMLGLLARIEIGPANKLAKPRLQADEKYPGRIYWPPREDGLEEKGAVPAEGVIRRYCTPLNVPLVAGYRFGKGSPLSNTTHRVWRRIRFHMELAFRRYLPEELVELMGGKPRD